MPTEPIRVLMRALSGSIETRTRIVREHSAIKWISRALSFGPAPLSFVSLPPRTAFVFSVTWAVLGEWVFPHALNWLRERLDRR